MRATICISVACAHKEADVYLRGTHRREVAVGMDGQPLRGGNNMPTVQPIDFGVQSYLDNDDPIVGTIKADTLIWDATKGEVPTDPITLDGGAVYDTLTLRLDPGAVRRPQGRDQHALGHISQRCRHPYR